METNNQLSKMQQGSGQTIHSLKNLSKGNDLKTWIQVVKLKTAERFEIKISDAVNSKMPILQTIKKDSNLMLEVAANFYEVLTDYIEIYHPGTNSGAVSHEFVELIKTNYYTWNPVDIQAFINFIKLNKPDVSGHKITPSELINSAMEYENERSEQIEMIKHNRKFESINQPVHDKVKDVLQTIIDKAEEKKRLKIEKINEKVNAAKQFKSEFNDYADELHRRLDLKEITEDEAVNLWYDFQTKTK